MALGKIKADTLEHSTAGSVDTQYVVNGSSKSWCNFNGESTIAIRDSLNVTSLTDDGTGDYRTNFSSNMSNANFSGLVMTGAVGEGSTASGRIEEVRGMSSSHLGMFCFNTSGAARDVEYFATSVQGDLA